VNAVAVLENLNEPDEVDRVYAEAAAPHREQLWRSIGFKQSSGIVCIQRVIGQRCNHYDMTRCRPPGTDHPRLLLRDGKPHSYVSEPYDLDMETLREMLAFADVNGLTFDLRQERAVHFPGHTACVVWRRKSTAGSTHGQSSG
jgi:hypothetical protein